MSLDLLATAQPEAYVDEEEIQLMDTDDTNLNFEEHVPDPPADVVSKPQEEEEEEIEERREEAPPVLIIEKRKVYIRDGPGSHHVESILTNDKYYELPTKEQLATIDLTEEKANDIWQSLNLTADAFRTSLTPSGISRPESLYVRGVTNMSTQTIFDYFEDFQPIGIEWVCDHSCNVFWFESLTPVRLLSTKSTPGPCIPHRRSTSDDHTVRPSKRKASSLTSTDRENNSADIPLPPGHWREGEFSSGEKAESTVKLYLRYTTLDDRKVRGAENQSEYYRNYGNPNYNNMTGLISRSKKRALNALKTNRFRDFTVVKSNDRASSSFVEEVPIAFEENATDPKVKFTVVLPPKKGSPAKEEENDDREDNHRSKRQRRRSWNDDNDDDRQRKERTHFTVTMDAVSRSRRDEATKSKKNDDKDEGASVTDARQILERKRRNRR